ncbi:MAG: hypothetical protein ACFFDQ_08775 [Candidatus Thorarchaeota archaeon]
MSEIPECPYCGASVPTDRAMDYDNKTRLRCRNCGGFFEYLPGFGAFRLPEGERMSSIRTEGSVPETYYGFPQSETPWEIERPPAEGGAAGAACFVILCMCCFLPILMFVIALMLGIGFFWF